MAARGVQTSIWPGNQRTGTRPAAAAGTRQRQRRKCGEAKEGSPCSRKKRSRASGAHPHTGQGLGAKPSHTPGLRKLESTPDPVEGPCTQQRAHLHHGHHLSRRLAAGATLQFAVLASVLGLLPAVSGQVDYCVIEPILDVGIVLDSSRSISPDNYVKAIQFAFQIVNGLPVAENEYRWALSFTPHPLVGPGLRDTL